MLRLPKISGSSIVKRLLVYILNNQHQNNLYYAFSNRSKNGSSMNGLKVLDKNTISSSMFVYDADISHFISILYFIGNYYLYAGKTEM